MSEFIDRFSSLAPAYDVVLCDVWGVLHNGVAAFPEASGALARFRAGGGHVVLISNAPRPGALILPLLHELGVSPAAYDQIVTSGDVTRTVMAERPGKAVFHLGPTRDLPTFVGLDLRLTAAEAADYVVCTGLFDDERETPDDYRALLGRLLARRLFMLCANPDVVVERGDRLIYCAGAIADAYGHLGGEVLYAGKPHRPIYEQALAMAATTRGAVAPLSRVLAIGDSVRTDLTGAAANGIDALFVTAGIHAEELGERENPDRAILDRIFAAADVRPRAVTRRLAW